jgi:guanylate kinase
VGKDAILARMKQAGFPFHYVVTSTTRPKRLEEKDGADYHFLSEDEFQRRIKGNQFLEWAKVYDNYYGVLRQEVKEALDQRQDVIVKVDVQGAATIKRILPDAIFVFVMPPSIEELVNRLKKRKTETDVELDIRLNKVREELESLPLFDYVVLSHKDELDLAVSQIMAIVTAEKCRLKPRMLKL